jgi:hypothetical protein
MTSEIVMARDGRRFSVFQAAPGSPEHDVLTLLGMVDDAVPQQGAGAEDEKW